MDIAPSKTRIARDPIPRQKCLMACCKRPSTNGNTTIPPMSFTLPMEGGAAPYETPTCTDAGTGVSPTGLSSRLSTFGFDAPRTIPGAQYQSTTVTSTSRETHSGDGPAEHDALSFCHRRRGQCPQNDGKGSAPMDYAGARK